MQNSAENPLFAQKKAYIDAYVALHRHLNEVFVRKLTDLNTDNLHGDREQKTKLLFHFVHYISVRSMKAVILDFNKQGRMQQTKLFQLYQDFSAGQPIEPYTLIENLAVMSFPISKGFLDHMRHVEPLEEQTYARMRTHYQFTLDTITQEEAYRSLRTEFIQKRENLLDASKRLSKTKLWHFKCAAMSLLITSVLMFATLCLMHLSLQAMFICGGVAVVGAIFLRVWREKLSDFMDPIVPEVYNSATLEEMFGEDFRFPAPDAHTPGFLNRVQEQLAPVMQEMLKIEMAPQRLALENGRPISVNGPSFLRTNTRSHLPIADAHTQGMLRLMDTAFETHQPPSYTQNLSNPTARIGYQNNHMYSGTTRIQDASKPLEITYDPAYKP